MCGIVGYLGEKSPKDVILSGLKRLEYRGYDSAGLAVLMDGEIERYRAKGKLIELEQKVDALQLNGSVGIGHTRWATHGAPSETNAHPHRVDDVVIVHNGIIENYTELREELVQQGATIQSDTDSELVAHLIAGEVTKTRDLAVAVKNMIPRLKGAFSVLAIWSNEKRHIVAFKDGPPLVIGQGKGEEVLVASDVQALVEHTRDVYFLQDREVALVSGEGVKLWDSENQEKEFKTETIQWDEHIAEKGGYPHFMLKEIHEQPRAFANGMQPYLDVESGGLSEKWVLPEDLLKGIERIYIVACGTSHYSSLYGKYLLEKFARVPVEVDIASEFRYRDPVVDGRCLFVTVSQSGETADTLAALRLAKEKGAKVLSICNVKGSSIDRESDFKMYMNSGVEIGVASTKVFVSTLGLLAVLALQFSKQKGLLEPEDEKGHVESLLAVPSHLETMLVFDKFFAEAAESLKAFRGFLYMGRGVNFPVALEGALKLKELAYLHAEGYAAGEMKHGPIALIDDTMCVIMLAPDDQLYEKTLSNLEEVKARGGRIISIGSSDNKRLEEISESFLCLPEVSWVINPILAVVPLQLMAYHLAESLGHDVDQPRNLAKSVTVE